MVDHYTAHKHPVVAGPKVERVAALREDRAAFTNIRRRMTLEERLERGEKNGLTFDAIVKRFNDRAEKCILMGAFATAFSYDLALAKLVGHYVEKMEVETTIPVDLAGALAAAATRVAKLRRIVDADAVDVTPELVEPEIVDPFA